MATVTASDTAAPATPIVYSLGTGVKQPHDIIIICTVDMFPSVQSFPPPLTSHSALANRMESSQFAVPWIERLTRDILSKSWLTRADTSRYPWGRGLQPLWLPLVT